MCNKFYNNIITVILLVYNIYSDNNIHNNLYLISIIINKIIKNNSNIIINRLIYDNSIRDSTSICSSNRSIRDRSICNNSSICSSNRSICSSDSGIISIYNTVFNRLSIIYSNIRINSSICSICDTDRPNNMSNRLSSTDINRLSSTDRLSNSIIDIPCDTNRLTDPVYTNRLTDPVYTNRLTDPVYTNRLTDTVYNTVYVYTNRLSYTSTVYIIYYIIIFIIIILYYDIIINIISIYSIICLCPFIIGNTLINEFINNNIITETEGNNLIRSIYLWGYFYNLIIITVIIINYKLNIKVTPGISSIIMTNSTLITYYIIYKKIKTIKNKNKIKKEIK